VPLSFLFSRLAPTRGRTILAVACLMMSTLLHAQTAPAAPAQTAVAAVPPAKQALIDRILTLWHPEAVAMVMVQRPAADAVQQARIALQGRVSAEKRDATVKDIAVDAQRYVDEATPLAQAAVRRQMPRTVVPMLAENFSEDELRQLLAMLESPVKQKFEQWVPKLERALGEKTAEDAGATIQPKLDTMKQAIAVKLRAASMVP